MANRASLRRVVVAIAGFVGAAILLAAPGTKAATRAEAAPGAEAELERGIHAYETQHYDEALSVIRPLAERGHVEAQYFMGMFYMYGVGVIPDAVASGTWFRRAYDQWLMRANQNDPASMVEVAMMLNAGLGVERDDAKAAQWLRRASDLNYVEAWTQMGHLYLAGEGVPRDRGEAERWYRKASKAGSHEADEVLHWLDEHPQEEVERLQDRVQRGKPF
jgi:uncharacterized protein